MPTRIGPYSPIRLLGRGGMASVYLATGPDGARVAVKWLARCTPHQVRRFQREVDTLSRLRHPHVVRFLGSGLDQGRPYLVMEYVEGQDLRMYAARLKQRPSAERTTETCRIGAEICEALTALHGLGLVHRDIKPSNVLLDSTGRSLLADFGVVKDAEEPDFERTAAGVLVGTTGYAAPEQILGGEVDHRADLYGLGCTLYFLLTCERPYPRLDRDQIARAQVHAEVPHASAIDPELPPALDATILRMMAKKPEDRFANAQAARAALAGGLLNALPPPLAGRRPYVDAVREALARIGAGPGRVIRPVGARGSGRRWLLEIAEDLARRQQIPFVHALDSAALHLALSRVRAGEPLAVVTRLPVPRSYGVEVDEIVLEPLGMADVRRTVVSVAPRTPSPHTAAERLHRASGGHPAWLLDLLQRHVQDQSLCLPDPVPPPPLLVERVAQLTFESIETLGALAMLGEAADVPLLEQVVQMPVEDALGELLTEGMVVRHGDEWALMGETVGIAAMARVPDRVAVHRRAAEALDARGLHGQATSHREAAGDLLAPAESPSEAFRAQLSALETRALRGELSAAREGVETLLAHARGHRHRKDEVLALLSYGQLLLDQGEAKVAESRLADAVALARALEMHAERRHAHVLRAVATLEGHPGSHSAASAALDRLHRALTRVEAREPDPARVLALAVRAQAAAVLGDRRARELADVAAEAELESLPAPIRLRVQLRLALAARDAGARAEAHQRAELIRSAAEQGGWVLLADQAARLADACRP